MQFPESAYTASRNLPANIPNYHHRPNSSPSSLVFSFLILAPHALLLQFHSLQLDLLPVYFLHLVPSTQCFILTLFFPVYFPQPNLLHKTISPVGSLHQSPNPLFPYIPPFLAQTLFFSKTLNIEEASCSKTSALNSYTRCLIPKDINLHHQCCKMSTDSLFA